MLGERALELSEKGCNCALCILKACQEEYKFNLSEDCYKCCKGLYNGLGVGSCCGVLLGCIMAIGIICDDVARCRIEMVERFNIEFGAINCCKIRGSEDCNRIIKTSCDILADIIDKSTKRL